jgi:hypothetical protein
VQIQTQTYTHTHSFPLTHTVAAVVRRQDKHRHTNTHTLISPHAPLQRLYGAKTNTDIHTHSSPLTHHCSGGTVPRQTQTNTHTHSSPLTHRCSSGTVQIQTQTYTHTLISPHAPLQRLYGDRGLVVSQRHVLSRPWGVQQPYFSSVQLKHKHAVVVKMGCQALIACAKVLQADPFLHCTSAPEKRC